MLNKFICQGRLTADAELRATASATEVATFTVAVERDFKDAEGKKQTDFLNCVAWRNTATFISTYFKKGSLICIEGSVQSRSYVHEGQKRYVTEILVEKAYFTGERRENATEAKNESQNNELDGFIPIPEEDLPFN